MAAIAKNGKPSPASLLIPANHKITGLFCGEDIAQGDACYIKQSDGKVYRAIGTTLDANAAQVDGFAATNAYFAQNDPVTLLTCAVWAYGTGLTPGKRVYLGSAVAGALADAASVGGVGPVGKTIDTTRIMLWASRY